MNKKILESYNIEYFFVGDFIDIWRNGKYLKIPSCIDIDLLEIVLDEFCIASPISVKKAKIDFPEYFISPEKGDYIAVRGNNFSLSSYTVKEFKEFKDDKIICLLRSGKEESYDFFQIINGDRHPSTTFWMNSCQNLVPWLVIEKLNTFYK